MGWDLCGGWIGKEQMGPISAWQGFNAAYQEMLARVCGLCRDLCGTRLPRTDTGTPAQSAELHSNEREAMNSLESKA